MLQQLHINNFVIINAAQVLFTPQLNIITGETGAGKSILMGALSLILGERAETNILINKEKKCVVEALFNVQNPLITSFLQQNEFEVANNNDIIIRREIAANGKSRAFINDTPANLKQLKELASYLVNLHQQFDTIEVGNANFQREVLDVMANNTAKLTEYTSLFNAYKQKQKQLQQLLTTKEEFKKEYDYNEFLFKELEQLNLQPNELEEAEQKLETLNNAEQIKTALSLVEFTLTDSEQAIATATKQLFNQVQAISKYCTQATPLATRLQSCYIELKDIAKEAGYINSDIVHNAEEINILNDKLNIGYKLQKKHNVNSTQQLIDVQQSLQQKLNAVLQIEDDIAVLQNQTKQLYNQAWLIAQQVEEARMACTTAFAKNIIQLLHKVGMPNAALKIEVTAVEQLNEFGKNNIEFLFDANNTQHFEPIKKVASGGELSRLMLCIKSLVANNMEMPTLIFDEIDTGISGEAAKQVAIILKTLSQQRQVICITHQPQIAAKAQQHLLVHKQKVNEVVETKIKTLSYDEAVMAIAKMQSGDNPSIATIESVKEMMN